MLAQTMTVIIAAASLDGDQTHVSTVRDINNFGLTDL